MKTATLNSMVWLLWLVVAASTQMSAQQSDIAVVVHRDNPVSNLTTAELRKVFSGEKRNWRGGLPVNIFLREPGSREHSAVLKLLQMSEYEFKQYWIMQVYRGEVPESPAILPSNGMQKEAITTYEGAIALVDAKDVKPGMKVVKINGRLPGEGPYPLH